MISEVRIECPNGHRMDPNWEKCPYCEAQKKESKIDKSIFIPESPQKNGKILGILVTYTWRPEGEVYPLREGKNYIGRNRISSDPKRLHRYCDIHVPEDERLSSEHAMILCESNEYLIFDQHSSNGTFLNGEIVLEDGKTLTNYSEIKTGATVWNFIITLADKPIGSIEHKKSSDNSSINLDQESRLFGKLGSYKYNQQRPFAYGSLSILFEGTNENEDIICIKRFRKLAEITTDLDSFKEFFKELSARRQLTHPNILEILDYDEGIELGSHPFIIYPMCEGGSLRKVLKEHSFMPTDEGLVILSQVAAGLDHAHSKGILHGDIKPENILLDRNNTKIYLSDFGMASLHLMDKGRRDTKVGYQGGTPFYESPEKIKGIRQTTKSDIYSLGLVTCELLTGSLPFNVNTSEYHMMEAKIKGKLERASELNPNVPKLVCAAIERALSTEQKDRPNSAMEFLKMMKGEFPIEVTRNKTEGFWSSLDAKNKVAIITAIIMAIAGIITASVKIIPLLIK